MQLLGYLPTVAILAATCALLYFAIWFAVKTCGNLEVQPRAESDSKGRM
ncbi:MAG: hypothetical protein KGN36_09520 [Acidobacteriota bacterium]|nr:hypothetical protein [Acidobacteriota bacterium]